MLLQIKAWFIIVLDTLFGKWFARGLGPPSDHVHPEAVGSTVIVTGSTSGIGLETAKSLAGGGVRVVLAVRSPDRATALLRQWSDAGIDVSQCEIRKLDVSSMASVNRFASEWPNDRPVHALVNNAGVFSMGVTEQKFTEEGFETHWATNHLGALLLTIRMLPAIKRAAGRVVMVSSIMHRTATPAHVALLDERNGSTRGSYSPTATYSLTKLAQISCMMHVGSNQETAAVRDVADFERVPLLCVHPGEVVTNVARTLPRFVNWLYKKLGPIVFFTPGEGARVVVHAATCPAYKGCHSKYIEPNFRAVTVPSPLACDPKMQAKFWQQTVAQLTGWLN